MPTFNQLVKKGRQTSVKKSTAPALLKSYNSLQKKSIDTAESRLQATFRVKATIFRSIA